MSAIAKETHRDKGSISREIDGKPRKGMGSYHAERAHKEARVRINRRGNIPILEHNVLLKQYVTEKLKLGWSPEQIAIRLPREYPRDKNMRISFESIYQYIYRQIQRGGNGAVKKGKEDLRAYLPRRHGKRTKKGFRKAQKLERNANLPSIETRPTIVENRRRVGDWEDDTLVSRQCGARIKSINERNTGVIFFGKTKDGTAKECDRVVTDRLSAIPKEYRLTLTRDRGTENYGYEEIEKELHISCYFAHAYSSYERGSNENGNGLLRRFFPKKTNWDKITDEEIGRAEYLINSRPRKRLNGLTPYEVFYKKTGVALIP